MKFKKASQADLRAMRGNAGPVVSTYPPDGGRVRVVIPDRPRSRRDRRRGK